MDTVLQEKMIEQTLILIKHDGVLKGLIGEVIKRFENINLKLVGLKMVWADDDLALNHYEITDEWAKAVAAKTRKAYKEKGKKLNESDMDIAKCIQQWNKTFLQEGPVVAIVFEGPHAVELGRKLVGGTEPRSAPPGTIRGDYSLESYHISDKNKRTMRNIVHASGAVEEAQREITLWFNDDELHDYEHHHDKHN